MKKILLPLVCCLMATSCLKENTFYMENYTDFATSYEGKLVTDNAYRFSVVDNQSGTEDWKKEGERFFIKCDILNRNLEIRLKSLLHVDIEEALPYTEDENEPDDPVEVMDQSVSGGYINLALEYFANPSSNAAHVLSCYYEANAAQDEFTFYVLHEGNDENPACMDEKKLERQSALVSIPLWNLLKKGTPTKLNLCLYQLKKAQDGTYTIEQSTFPLYGGSIIL